MAKRRKRGDGGIREEGNAFEGVYTIYWKNGKSKRKSFRRKNINDIKDIIGALRNMEALDDNVEDIIIDKNNNNKIRFVYKGLSKNNVSIDKELVKEFIDYFIWEYRRKGVNGKIIKDTTVAGYVDKGQHIKNALGDMKVAELTFEDIEKFLLRLHNKTCDTTARQTRNLIYSMMDFAKQEGIIKENILEGRKINFRESKGKKEKKILHKEDESKLIDYCLNHKHYDILMLMFTGARRK